MFSNSLLDLLEDVDKAVQTEEEALVRALVDARVVEAAVRAVGEVYQPQVHEVRGGGGDAAHVAARVVRHRAVADPRPPGPA